MFKPAPMTPAANHNITQAMYQEITTLKDRLNYLELERIKLHTILLQLKGKLFILYLFYPKLSLYNITYLNSGCAGKKRIFCSGNDEINNFRSSAGILSDMHERSNRFAAGIASNLNMSQREVRVARLRNLFIILKAVTRLSPLTPEDLSQINYDVGLFNPRVTDDGKVSFN